MSDETLDDEPEQTMPQPRYQSSDDDERIDSDGLRSREDHPGGALTSDEAEAEDAAQGTHLYMRILSWLVLGKAISDRSVPPRNEIRYTLLVAIGATCAIVTLVQFDSLWGGITFAIVALIGAVMSSVGSLSAAAFDRSQDSDENHFEPALYSHDTEDQPLDVHPASAICLSSAITEPHTYYIRIKQSVRQLSLAFEVKTQYTLKLGRLPETADEPDASGSVYLPVILARKGTLHDDLRIRWKGSEVPTATYEESLKVVRQAVRTISIDHVDIEQLNDYIRLEDKILQLVAPRGEAPLRASDDQARTSPAMGRDDLSETIEQIWELFSDDLIADTLESLVTILTRHYFIFAVVPIDELHDVPWIVIETEERQILEPRASPRREGGIGQGGMAALSNFVAKFSGLRPDQIEYPATMASLGGSYHLEIMGGEGTYLWRQRIYVPTSYTYRYRRFRSRQGQRYLHLYLRGVQAVGIPLPEAASEDLRPSRLRSRAIGSGAAEDIEVSARFKERMPGRYPSATVAAGVSTAVLGMANVLSHQAGGTSDVELFGLLLAAPGAIAAFSSVATSTRPVGASLAPFLSRALTLVLTLAALGLYFAERIPTPAALRHLPLGEVPQGLWRLLALAAAVNLIMILLLWLKAALVQFSFLEHSFSEFLRGEVVRKSAPR